MKDELITFETAKLAKEKGFEFVGNFYHVDKGYKIGYALCYSNSNSKEECLIPAPTQSLLQRWLREVHRWYVNAELNKDGKYISVLTYMPKNQRDYWNENFNSFEDALEFVLQEALKLIKIKDE